MDILREYIRELVVVVFFATFLELLLPKSDFARYIKLVVGLMIIAIIMNPLRFIIGLNPNFNMTQDNFSALGRDTEIILAQGEKLSDWQNQRIDSDVEKRLKLEIEDIVVEHLPKNWNFNTNTRIQWEDNTFKIQQLIIEIYEEEKKSDLIEQVKIEVSISEDDESKDNIPQNIEKVLTESLSNYLQIEQEKIIIERG